MNAVNPHDRPGLKWALICPVQPYKVLACTLLLLLGSEVQAGATKQRFTVSAQVVAACTQLATLTPGTSEAQDSSEHPQLSAQCSEELDYTVIQHNSVTDSYPTESTTQVVTVAF